jgi:hypothetical protein
LGQAWGHPKFPLPAVILPGVGADLVGYRLRGEAYNFAMEVRGMISCGME